MKLKVIGDVHGRLDAWSKLTAGIVKPDVCITLGDMGWAHPDMIDRRANGTLVVPGNHDHPPEIYPKCYLPDYGEVPGIPRSFYVRGAWSIDKAYRIPGRDWFPEEQLNDVELAKAYESYIEAKPRVVFTHEAPCDVMNQMIIDGHVKLMMGDKRVSYNRTNMALQVMYDAHHPEIWVFGHYHTSVDVVIGDTRFRCLDELEVWEFDYEV